MFTVTVIDRPEMSIETSNSLVHAIYIYVGMRALHPALSIVIQDSDGYIVPASRIKEYTGIIINQ